MLTGDNERVARAVGREVGVDDVRADLLPEQKVAGDGGAPSRPTARWA